MRAAGGKALLIAKIERAEAIPALEDIMKACDGIMVARGDLAVEVGDASVPALQKRMIRMAREHNKLTITATQMMESMISSPMPDARRSLRRGQRGARRHRRRDAVGGIRQRQVSGARRSRRWTGSASRPSSSQPVNLDQDFLEPAVHPRRPVDRDGGAVHRVSPEGQGDRLADRVGFDGAVDEPPQLRRADLCADFADRHPVPGVAVPGYAIRWW